MKSSEEMDLMTSTSSRWNAVDSDGHVGAMIEGSLRAGDKAFERTLREIMRDHGHAVNFTEWFASIVISALEKHPPTAPKLKILRKVLHQESRRIEREQAIEKESDHYETQRRAAWVEYRDWIKSSPPPPLQMQKPDGSVCGRLVRDIENGLLFGAQAMPRSALENAVLDNTNESSKFVLEHDWASAFKGSSEYVGGEFSLPDEVCLFEMKIDGRPVTVVATVDQGMIICMAVIRLKTGWVVQGTFAGDGTGALFSYTAGNASGLDLAQNGTFNPLPENGTDHRLSTAIFNQVRAAAIAMEANVAEASEPIRAEYRRNAPKSDRSVSGYSYHVVSLSRRSGRAAALPRDGDEPSRHVRLHFRRGHWRHYDGHKTWIKWTLVGDPDLGFVDKHYRL